MTTNEITTTVIGNLGKDGELRTLPSGHTVAITSIAVNVGENVQWLKVQIWGDKRSAGVVDKLRKGELMKFTGTPKADAWLKDGKAMSALVLNVSFNDKIGWLGTKPADTADQNVQEPQPDEIPF